MKQHVGIVNYLNTKPLLAGLHQSEVSTQMIIHELNPAECAEWMHNAKLDIALVPIAFLLDDPTVKTFSNYGIGCSGQVRTVCLVSNSPVENLSFIHLDNHSKTSVKLLQILLNEFWKVDIPTKPAEISACHLSKNEGMLIIGDKAFELYNEFPYVYDLGEIWKEFTGLDFLFARWVSREPLSTTFIAEFDKAQNAGIQQIDRIIKKFSSYYPRVDLARYYDQNIEFEINDSMRKSMDLYLSKLSSPALI